jgi:hypothetical protein
MQEKTRQELAIEWMINQSKISEYFLMRKLKLTFTAAKKICDDLRYELSIYPLKKRIR